MDIIGYILAIFIGLSLGLVGSGGSILTVPLLVYCFDIEPTVATSYSLFIVGTASGVGTAMRMKQGQVNFRIVALFGMTSILTVFLTRRFILPAIPDTLFYLGEFAVTKSLIIMVMFAVLILLSALFVLRGHPERKYNRSEPPPPAILLFYGLCIGLLTGFLGAGGGFLIVPVLMLLFRSSIKVAAGTSLAIITVNTLLGWLGDIGHIQLDWQLLVILLTTTLIGLFFGNALSQRINAGKLARGFGWFLLSMAVVILFVEISGLF